MKRKVSFEPSDKISSKQKKRQRDLQYHSKKSGHKSERFSTKMYGTGKDKDKDYSRSKTKHKLRQELESETDDLY